MLLYFIRHGETDWNTETRLQGRTDIPLNKNGRHVAELTRDALKDIKFDVAFTSPLQRARETAEIVLEGREVPIFDDERIIEISFGKYEGQTPEESDENRKLFFSRPELYKAIDGAESIEEVFAREADFLKELFANEVYKDSTVLISTHGAALSGLLCVIKGYGAKDFWKDGLHQNCGMSIVKVEDGKTEIVREAFILYDESLITKAVYLDVK